MPDKTVSVRENPVSLREANSGSAAGNEARRGSPALR
jgi:hypothetical protein